MVKRKINENSYVELSNLEDGTCCRLNIKTNKKKFFSWKKITSRTIQGFYYCDSKIFFALFESLRGPIMYFEGKEYPLTSDLHIEVKKDEKDKQRVFVISEYGICIKYNTSPYIGFDVWSTEEDVDLFYQIAMNYKKEDYYKKFTK